MTRELVYETPLMVKLDPQLKRRLKLAAVEYGTDMSKLVREAIAAHLDELDRQRRADDTRGRRLVEHMQGRGTVQLSTDEIMALTRGE